LYPTEPGKTTSSFREAANGSLLSLLALRNGSADGSHDPSPEARAFDIDLIANLPPDLRDELLDYAQTWQSPASVLALVEAVREAHGPLLFLLDYQAAALLAQQEANAALEVAERRQKRSSSIASRAIEVRALQRAGYESHALAMAEELTQTWPRSLTAQRAAAEVFAAQQDGARALAILQTYLETHPGEPSALLSVARMAFQQGEIGTATAVSERLGVGVPADLPDIELGDLHALMIEQGRSESAAAVTLEMERRRAIHWQKITALLAPWLAARDFESTGGDDLGAEATPVAENETLFHRINGPESIPLSRTEERRIQLEAVRNFGFGALREGQPQTIASVLRGESILAVMPTGAGKSLCYQLPALMAPRASLIISPLIALMKDQVDSLPAAARRQATYINSTIPEEEIASRMQGVEAGKYKLIYAAPERLRQREFLRALHAAGVDLFVVDEAHCVSLWGHDFRPDYLFLQEARAALGNPATLAMTATAPPRVRDEILDYMRTDSGDTDADATSATEGAESAAQTPRVLALDIFRSNLHLSALRFANEDEKLAAAIKFVTETEGSGIIYVNTRHKSESLAAALRSRGVLAEAYHAGMENRGAIQDRFMSNKTRVVIATVAFGMGIDKPDIRFILHFHPSRSLAGYYQEVGRAGRDGKPSQGVLFYSNNDWANLRRWARADEYDAVFLMRVLAAVGAQLGVSEGTEHNDLDGAVDARRLQSVLNVDETTVRVAISLLERADLLRRGFDVAQDVTVSLPRKNAMPAAAAQDETFGDLLKGLALSPGQSAGFRLNDIASFMGWNLSDCELMLLEWQAKGYLKVQLSRRAMFIELPTQPADAQARLERILAQSQALGNRRIDDISGYATTEGCRHGYISAHFGSPPRIRCTVCDNCTGVRPDLPVPVDLPHLLPDDADLEPMILDSLISLPRTVGRGGLARILAGSLRAPYTPDKARHHGALKAMGEGGILEYIDDLLESGRLRQYERQGFMVLGTTVSGRAEAEAWLAEHPDLNQYGEAPLADEEETTADADAGERFTALQKAIWLWRRRLAEELGQPAYVVMSNETMIQIAETRPATMEALATLPGMGEQRLNRYGETILDLVRLHPAGAEDVTLLRQQREQLAIAKEKQPLKSVTVSPRAERRIYMKMQELRQQIAVQGKGKYAEIASNTLLKEIARTGPASLAELEALPGFRSSALPPHADRIIAEVQAAIRADAQSERA